MFSTVLPPDSLFSPRLPTIRILRQALLLLSLSLPQRVSKRSPRVPREKFFGSKRSKPKRSKGVIGKSSTPHKAKSPTMIRAEEVQSRLKSVLPSCVKTMVRSNVSGCFQASLPTSFCKSHLPKDNAILTLEDERGEKYETKFAAKKSELTSGWKQFSLGNKLAEGDVLIFRLVESTKLKVIIIRANDITKVGGDAGLQNLDALGKESDSDNAKMGAITHKNTKRKRLQCLQSPVSDFVHPNNKKAGKKKSLPNNSKSAEETQNESETLSSKSLLASQWKPALRFEDVVKFRSFSIVVNQLVGHSELSEDICFKYYKLCCSQNAFLHDNVVEGFNHTVLAGVVTETVNIADSISACSLNTSRDELVIWGKTLKAFELLGMNVGFLNARLHKLESLVFEWEGAMDRKKYTEARTEQACVENEIKTLEAKLVGLKETSEMLAAKIQTLKSKAESYELKFQELVTAPW